jgi:FtsP/CotA-like multicopper oxidase with cupredoxin domain
MQSFFVLFVFFLLSQFFCLCAYARSDDLGNLGAEQAVEKSELQQMRQQLKELKATTSDALNAFNKLDTSPLKKGLKEFHLICKSATHEISPGKTIECLTYNGLLPGTPIRAKEGQLVRIIVHNQLDQGTSFHLHGMVLPESVDGIPNSQSGLIKAGDTYVYQFVAKPAGTYWYHPQIMHADQKVKGMYGAFIVEPDTTTKIIDSDVILILGDTTGNKIQVSATSSAKPSINAASKIAYLINGKTAPAIPAIEVRPNSRVRLRIINASQHAVPLHITGHKFELVSLNGNLTGEQTTCDTITCGVSDRIDIEFTANNPGLWSIGSELLEQSTNNGQFPGGIACLIRYVD